MKIKVRVRDQRNGAWYWIAREVYHSYSSKIGVIGLALYNAYASYAFDIQKVFPSQTTIAKKLDISVPTLIKYNNILLEYKLIRIRKQEGGVNIITLLKIGPLKEIKGGTKRPLDPPLKEVKTNNKVIIKRKNNTVASKLGNGLIFPKNKKTFYDNCSVYLIKLLQSKNKIMRKPNKKQWALQFKKLHVQENVKKSEIKKVLKWYSLHISEKYVPDIRSAKTFRIKFDDVRAAMDRHQKKVDKGEAKTIYKVRKRKVKR